MHAQPYWIPKLGSSDAEFEDAVFPSIVGNLTGSSIRVAIADGASETSFSGLWARILVNAVGTQCISLDFLEAEFRDPRKEWRTAVGEKPLPWFAEEKLASGTYSSLVAFEITDTDELLQWRASAIGDSCIFHIRQNDLIAAFPCSDASSFTNRPELLWSLFPDRPTAVERTSGKWEYGDEFVLMTDALAACFLRMTEQKEIEPRPAEFLAELRRDFPTRIAALRSSGRLRNDDVTLLYLKPLNTEP